MELSEVMKEIRLVPEDRLPEIYDLIHSLIPDPEIIRDDTEKNMARNMKFAGCWQDITDEEFAEFSQEIASRRRQAFSGRIGRETVID